MIDNYELHDQAELLMAKMSHYQLARQVILMNEQVQHMISKLDSLQADKNTSNSSQD